MFSKTWLFFFVTSCLPFAVFAQDTSRIPRVDTPFAKTLKAATITRPGPLVQRQIDRIVIHVDRQIINSGMTALEMIRQLPGVQMTDEGQVSLNGRAGANIFIDGKPTQLSADDLASLLRGMSSSSVEQVEIMTNPPAKYDAAGTGGIINIVRKKNKEEGWNGNLSGNVGEGHYPRYGGSLLINCKTNRYNLFLNYSYNYNKSLLGGNSTAELLKGGQLLTRQVSANQRTSTARANHGLAGIDWYLTKRTTLTLSANGGSRTESERVNSLLSVFPAGGGGSGGGGQSFTALNADHPVNYTTGLQLRHLLDTTGSEFSIDADYSEFHYWPGQYNATLFLGPTGDLQGRSDVFLDQTRVLRIAGARADYVRPWPGKGKFEAGLKSSYVATDNNSSYYNQAGGRELIDSTQSDYNRNTENINAAYLNVDRQFRRLTLQAGLRAEQTVMKGRQLYNVGGASVEQHYFQLFPTLFIDDRLDSRNNLNVQLGRRIDRADYHELVPFRRPQGPTLFFQGNPYLRPALTWHGEMTWSWKNLLFLTAGYDIDKDYVRTLPYLDANDSTTTRIPTNLQGARSWNVDLVVNHSITKWWTTNTTASLYLNSFTGTANGFPLDNRGIVSFYGQSDNNLTLTRSLSAEVDFEYNSKRQIVQSTYGAYSILSLGLKQQLPGKKAAITLNAHNILQGENRAGVDHYLDLNQYNYNRFYTRAVTLSFSYRFGSGKTARNQDRSGTEDERQRAGN
ncbi:outer membrane beta-barrel protein [Puia sp.]|jgi:hypothetical protein|uniref:outer membrane beta-barrel protein n=1 Tax=Puia sp. TaxID=2045100 RepID=UPI002F3E3F5A